jgi:hypothetical protein
MNTCTYQSTTGSSNSKGCMTQVLCGAILSVACCLLLPVVACWPNLCSLFAFLMVRGVGWELYGYDRCSVLVITGIFKFLLPM